MNLVMIGLPGSGKTTFGKELSQILNMPFFDTDEMILNLTGKTPRELYANGLYEAEKQVVRSLIGVKNSVIATGGSTPLDKENRAILSSLGVVYFLDVPPKICFERVMKKGKPAYIKGNNPKKAFLELVEKRRAIYTTYV